MNSPGFFSISMPNQANWKHYALNHWEGTDNYLLIAPFVGDATKFKLEPTEEFKAPNLIPSENKEDSKKTEYLSLINDAIEWCTDESKKVVCSRSQFYSANVVDPTRWLDKLKSKYPIAFVYMLQLPNGKCWIGASPELLVKKENGSFLTHSLAGTKWGNDSFTEKEFLEQRVVTDIILKDLGLDQNCASQAREVQYGALRHLRSKIEWRSDNILEYFAEKLHPTPAVCGNPKDAAREFILENEHHDRDLYTGYFLLSGIASESLSFVNLRCGQVFSNGIRIFAGGGINGLSEANSELEETERKMETIAHVIGLDDENKL